MSFAFNFSTNDQQTDEPLKDQDTMMSGPDQTKTPRSPPSSSSSSFSWLSEDDVKTILQRPLHSYQSDVVNISSLADQNSSPSPGAAKKHPAQAKRKKRRKTTTTTTTTITTMRHVKEGTAPSPSYEKTDLVPGKYEGGMKVWECSVDLCRWLQDNHPSVMAAAQLPPENEYDKGTFRVLELGCGHGLPGCWVLCHALRKYYHRQEHNPPNMMHSSMIPKLGVNVYWTDFNKFCIDEVTIPNVLLNLQECIPSQRDRRGGADCGDGGDDEDLEYDLSSQIILYHTSFGAGDWNAMSSKLLGQEQILKSLPAEERRPGGGTAMKFDLILAAETTYTEEAAKDTARIICDHLSPGKGVAIISTKRYYFGVGGGSQCFCDAVLESGRRVQKEDQQQQYKFHIETAQVFDDGVSNIREVIVVKSIAM